MSEKIIQELKESLERRYPNKIDQIWSLTHREAHFMYKANYSDAYKKQVEEDGDNIDLRSQFEVAIQWEKYGDNWGFDIDIWNDWGHCCQGHFVKTTSISHAIRKGLEESLLIDEKGNEIVLEFK